jgi:hypothetical protein
MHDPLVVAFGIHRPWPSRARRLNGRRRWPVWVTVWHREPGGRDSGEVCKHFRNTGTGIPGTATVDNRWRWHIHHWKLQVIPLQMARSRLLDRCGWCGGRDRKGDPVNVASGWRDDRAAHWWQGDRTAFHSDCHTVYLAHRKCLCDTPVFDHGGYGTCTLCGRHRGWRCDPTPTDRLLAALPDGARITPDVRAQLDQTKDTTDA